MKQAVRAAEKIESNGQPRAVGCQTLLPVEKSLRKELIFRGQATFGGVLFSWNQSSDLVMVDFLHSSVKAQRGSELSQFTDEKTKVFFCRDPVLQTTWGPGPPLCGQSNIARVAKCHQQRMLCILRQGAGEQQQRQKTGTEPEQNTENLTSTSGHQSAGWESSKEDHCTTVWGRLRGSVG